MTGAKPPRRQERQEAQMNEFYFSPVALIVALFLALFASWR